MLLEALKKINELTRPGQTLDLREAIDTICAVWNISDIVISSNSERSGDAKAVKKKT